MRFRTTATLVWTFQSDQTQEKALEEVKSQIEQIPLSVLDFSMVVRLDNIKNKVGKLILGEFAISDVIPYISKEDIKKEYECNGTKYSVKMNSMRYFVFRESLKCAACGLEGTKMILEKNLTDRSPFFNLYAYENNKQVLMTKDHIQPKSRGGSDSLENYATYCSICNNLKANHLLTHEQVGQLRFIMNSNRHKSKRNQSEIMKNTRQQMLDSVYVPNFII